MDLGIRIDYTHYVSFNNETYAKQVKIRLLDRFIDSVVVRKRDSMWTAVTAHNENDLYLKLHDLRNCLDVGTTSDEHYESSNFFLKKLPQNIPIYSFSDQEIRGQNSKRGFYISKSFIGSISSELKISEKFEFVICSATLEHVGSIEKQKLAINNLVELTSRYLLITVPNRWHPIEFHSRLPLIHWLPEKLWRRFFGFFPSLRNLALEQNLNFISPQKIESVLAEIEEVKEVKIFDISLLGFTSNFAILVSIK
jgi:hypothetical protein